MELETKQKRIYQISDIEAGNSTHHPQDSGMTQEDVDWSKVTPLGQAQ